MFEYDKLQEYCFVWSLSKEGNSYLYKRKKMKREKEKKKKKRFPIEQFQLVGRFFGIGD